MKKHGIKLSAIALALSFLIFTGCSSAPALSFAGAYFLPDPSAVTVGDVNETCEYTLKRQARGHIFHARARNVLLQNETRKVIIRRTALLQAHDPAQLRRDLLHKGKVRRCR